MGASLDELLLAQEHFAAGCGSTALAVNMHVSPTGQGVTVNAVVPAAIRGPVMDTVPDERLAALEQSIPVGRFIEATEVAEMVAFLSRVYLALLRSESPTAAEVAPESALRLWLSRHNHERVEMSERDQIRVETVSASSAAGPRRAS